MQDKKLHEVIADVIRNVGRPIPVSIIAETIKKKDLWRRPSDSAHPESTQVNARIVRYPKLFLREKGVVHLLVDEIQDTRLLRLTWNTNNWELPSGHKWKKANQGNSDIAFENQYGFGGEEWLFNPRYRLDGYQYGYIRGVENLSESVQFIGKAYLFTIDQQTSNRFLLGNINGLEIIRNDKTRKKSAVKLYNLYTDDVREELKMIDADLKGIDIENFYPTVRFKVEGNDLFEQPIPIPGLEGRRYNRFQPYKVDSDLQKIIAGVIPKKSFTFEAGIAKNTKQFTRSNVASTRTIKRLHGDITDALIEHLKPNFSVKLGNLSVEKTCFGENISDIVLKNSDSSYSLIEVKTSNNARKNIREALGQLLDYAFWYDDLTVKELVIVSPSYLEEGERQYLQRIRNHFKIRIKYWQYSSLDKGGDSIKEIC